MILLKADELRFNKIYKNNNAGICKHLNVV